MQKRSALIPDSAVDAAVAALVDVCNSKTPPPAAETRVSAASTILGHAIDYTADEPADPPAGEGRG